MRELELLAPAADVNVAMEAILHGADAVYIGASSHGARKAASNSLEDIKGLVNFAHPFRARVYVTVNTIVYEHELESVRSLIRDLYYSGVDAIIVQDMSILRMDLPPIALHASTQCDTRTLAKARFLEDVGFSQIVLARELTLSEIREICIGVSVPVECFVHGALCVSYSGRCHASQSACGRSANRGECSQICRLPFTLTDSRNKILAKDRHLLSMKDFNLSDRMEELVEAGVTSFKIEGRLKDASYVKNITSFYRRIIDDIISAHPDMYRRSSCGVQKIDFKPNLAKSFNRGFTHYFLDSRTPVKISSPLTPKSMGEIVKPSDLNNGDGISYFNENKEYVGVNVNRVDERGKIFTARSVRIPKGAELHRTYDREWQTWMAKPTAIRKIRVDISIDKHGVTAYDERGVRVRLPLDVTIDVARKPMDTSRIFGKLGNTIYELRDFTNNLPADIFIPASELTDLRQRLVELLDKAAETTYIFDKRRAEHPNAIYPHKILDYQDNVANSLAESFYLEHGVSQISPAMEVEKNKISNEDAHRKGGRSVMTTRHCILREMGQCLKRGGKPNLPLKITSGNMEFTLDFDCKNCEMNLLSQK